MCAFSAEILASSCSILAAYFASSAVRSSFRFSSTARATASSSVFGRRRASRSSRQTRSAFSFSFRARSASSAATLASPSRSRRRARKRRCSRCNQGSRRSAGPLLDPRYPAPPRARRTPRPGHRAAWRGNRRESPLPCVARAQAPPRPRPRRDVSQGASPRVSLAACSCARARPHRLLRASPCAKQKQSTDEPKRERFRSDRGTTFFSTLAPNRFFLFVPRRTPRARSRRAGQHARGCTHDGTRNGRDRSGWTRDDARRVASRVNFNTGSSPLRGCPVSRCSS